MEPLQGIDYVYNLAGQLKAINHPSLEAAKDPGGDADDAFGMYIDYYRGDYQRENAFKSTPENSNGIDQYNGNIKALTWSIRTSDTQTVDTYYYKYTKENWLEAASFNTAIAEEDFTLPEIVTLSQASTQTLHTVASEAIVLGPGFHFSATDTQQFSAKISSELSHSLGDGAYNVYDISYDANGNIQTLHRNKDTENGSPQMDALTYVYDTIKPNQLQRVEDAVTASIDADDLKNQTGENYRYNALGQLVENKQDSLLYAYTASGLVSEIQKNNLPYVKFYYNDKGFRVRKETYHEGNLSSTQYYVRDAAGSVMAIYNDQTQAELPIYGAKRLGVFYKSGSTQFELTDHLGNVRAVVEKSDPTPSIFADYYPGGMQMPNRNSQGDYRYAYQGQEKDPETGKEAFQLRLYDSRINRWLTTDPYGQYFSPYLAMGNRPNMLVDRDGGCVDEKGNPCAHGDIGSSTLDGGGNSWTWDGDTFTTDFAFGLNEVSITGQTTDHARTMSNPLIQSIHQAQFNFMTHDVTKAFGALIAAPFVWEAALFASPHLSSGSLFSFSSQGLGSRVALETGSEILANGGDLTKVNLAGIAASAFTGLGSEVTGSFLRYTYEDGFKIESIDAAVINFGVGKVNKSIHGSLSKASNLLGNQGAVLGMRYSLDLAGQTGTKLLGGEISK